MSHPHTSSQPWTLQGSWFLLLRNVRVGAAGNSGSEATFMLGFKDISHFIRVFRKYYGVTPGNL
ncbi:AraC family transcriptional regulator [Paenibacillus oceani]|uniref:AraC family transcriptional regulator n=1 Tax=Paenibacillus oceani TaxID=2772510 RepID=A0A927CJH6_9BACL|nr:AraC family transcriptional regulator [Paenibacillus oceani]